MAFLTELWLPILLAAVFVFIASSVIHMAIPIHKHDHSRLPNEAVVLTTMREAGVGPGSYMFPFADSMKDMGSPEMLAKFQAGPVGFARIFPNGPMAIGKSLAQWFAFSIVVSAVAAYLAHAVLPAGESYLQVFRVTGTVAFVAYGFGSISESIWKGQSFGTTARYLFDALVYGLVTAGAFGWLWPAP